MVGLLSMPPTTADAAHSVLFPMLSSCRERPCAHQRPGEHDVRHPTQRSRLGPSAHRPHVLQVCVSVRFVGVGAAPTSCASVRCSPTLCCPSPTRCGMRSFCGTIRRIQYRILRNGTNVSSPSPGMCLAFLITAAGCCCPSTRAGRSSRKGS